jgi:hypothetical protein
MEEEVECELPCNFSSLFFFYSILLFSPLCNRSLRVLSLAFALYYFIIVARSFGNGFFSLALELCDNIMFA